ncbi:hypothetical protein CONPUDRAFT_156908 [Coniophora puteana RWD-64-598 SS2]|uniref:Uncharacterized protein n=1 Tax=Coniophora puteana (strain RWD-64-598) TaxID=741705 RepID=A0A5M3MGJ3_CONPW|nr:uncharacterized protein CONPUDRAFT_156908 [Coniophora puteana RWD-64-598 SS2]EIW77721.1 hypothetical protein CONPUDRAFT_156908 [Coniophora puteana RWD-64-598 SS2]
MSHTPYPHSSYPRSPYPRSPYPRSPPNSPASGSGFVDVPAPVSPDNAAPSSTGVAPPSSGTESPIPTQPTQHHPPSSFPAQPSPSDPLQAFAFLSKKPAYAVDFNVGHFNIHMQGSGTNSEIVTACVRRCCLDLISETVAELFVNSPDYRVDFQEMVQAAVRKEVLNIYNDKNFTRFFQQCAGQEIHRQNELARARVAAANSARSRSDGEIVEEFSHLPTNTRAASGPRSQNVEYTKVRGVNEDRLPFGVIPPDGIINRNLNAAFRALVADLPLRSVKLSPSVVATYITPHATSAPPYYWVPYGYAIGVFSNADIYHSLWSGGRGSVGHQVFSLEEALDAMDNALREGYFGLIR